MNFKTFFSEGNAAINDFMKEQLLLQENDHVLEIGFGTGKLIFEMAKRVNKGLIEGIDLSETMVAIAEKRNKNYLAQGRVIIRQGDFEETAYNDNRFDKICSANTMAAAR
jgi:ubiquinone/menaquinone biosynthesis C-methylase UbiE